MKPSADLLRWLKIKADTGVSINDVDITNEIRQLLNEFDDALVGGLRIPITQTEVIAIQEKLTNRNYPVDCLGYAEKAVEALGFLALNLGDWGKVK